MTLNLYSLDGEYFAKYMQVLADSIKIVDYFEFINLHKESPQMSRDRKNVETY